MNLDAIKKKLESMQKTTNNGGNNYPKSRRFKPSVGKQTVRVVPFKYNKDYPFTEMKFYYGIGSRKVIASPLNWGEKDDNEFIKHENKEALQHHNHLKARLIQREKSHHQLEKKANMIKRPNLGFHRPIKTNTTIDTIQLAKTNVTSHIDSKFLNEYANYKNSITNFDNKSNKLTNNNVIELKELLNLNLNKVLLMSKKKIIKPIYISDNKLFD